MDGAIGAVTTLALALWGALAIGAAVMVASHRHGHSPRAAKGLALRRSIAAVLAACGLIQLVGAASGGTNPLQPLAHVRGATSPASPGPAFKAVRNVAELGNALRTAGRPVMLDFYADWCISYKEMDRFTFVDPAVQKRLAGALLLKADITANNADDRAAETRQPFRPARHHLRCAGPRAAPCAHRRPPECSAPLQILQNAGL